MLPQNVHDSPSSSMTKVATGMCVLSATVSFLGYLPRFAPYTVFQLSNLLNKFPKVWILFTSAFYNDTLFTFLIQCVMFIYTARIIEPIWGSKEFLRFIIMSAIYPTLIIFLFAMTFYFATGFYLLPDRVFLTNSVLSGALLIAVSKVLYDVSIPTQFGNFKPKYIAFMSFTISVFFSVIGKCDSLLGNICGSAWALAYLKYLQPHNGVRGDSHFTILGLLPSQCCTLCDQDEDGGNGDDGNVPPLGPNPMFNNQNGNNNNNNDRNRRNNRDNQFIGTPHRIG